MSWRSLRSPLCCCSSLCSTSDRQGRHGAGIGHIWGSHLQIHGNTWRIAETWNKIKQNETKLKQHWNEKPISCCQIPSQVDCGILSASKAYELHHHPPDGLSRGLCAGECHGPQGSRPALLHHRRGKSRKERGYKKRRGAGLYLCWFRNASCSTFCLFLFHVMLVAGIAIEAWLIWAV